MDIRIQKYIQYKIRTLNERKKELERLMKQREELRKDIIDESPTPADGQPRGKGGTSNPVESKVLRLEKVDRRIGTLDEELKKFAEVEEKVRLMGREPYTIYKKVIEAEYNGEYIAMELGMSFRTFCRMKAGLIRYIAEELGEYLEEDND